MQTNFNITNKNLAYLKSNKKIFIKTEPKFKSYNKPSEKMQIYKHASSGILGLGLAYGGTKVLDLVL